MEQNYKKNMLDWLAGNYQIEESGANVPTFTPPATTVGNFKTQIGNELENFSITNIIECNSANSDTNLMVAYGTYQDGSITRGFIAIVDNNANLVQLMKTYDDGTKMKPYIVLEMGDDGNFYGIDRDSADTTRNFVLLNNIVGKLPTQTEYEVKIRKTYTIPSGNAKSQNIVGIVKKPGNSVYLIYGDTQTTTNNSMPWLTRFTINVSSTNEWKSYTYSNSQIQVSVKAIYVSDWENFTVQIGAFDYVISNYNVWYSEYSISNADATTLTRSLKTRLLLASGSPAFGVSMYGIEIYDNTYAYVQYGLTHTGNPTTQRILRVERSTGDNTIILENISDQTAIMPYPMQLKKVNNVIFAMWCDAPTTPGEDITIQVGQIVGANIYNNTMIYITQNGNYTGDDYDDFFFVNNVYEVYTVIALGSRYIEELEQSEYITVRTQEVYRLTGYNGTQYNGLDAMVPYDAVLYDNNENVIFARGLYNKVITGNILTATVEIPNISVNDIQIGTKELKSNTNSILVTDAIPFTKNIYEAVYLNFTNTVNMVNRNDIDNETLNTPGASRIVNSTANILDYEDTKANKYRVNYIDNTMLEKDIVPTFNEDYNNPIYTYEFLVYVGKEISNIQIISKDGNTAYITIDGTALEVNKFYRIRQEVTIE